MGYLCSVTVLTSDPIKGLEIQPLFTSTENQGLHRLCRKLPPTPIATSPDAQRPVSSSQARPEPSEPTGIFQTSPCLPASPNLQAATTS